MTATNDTYSFVYTYSEEGATKSKDGAIKLVSDTERAGTRAIYRSCLVCRFSRHLSMKKVTDSSKDRKISNVHSLYHQ